MKKFLGFAVFCFMLFAATQAFAFSKGDRVLGLWEDGFWYPATVVNVDGGVLTLSFDDGDVVTIDSERVEALDWQAGVKVECRWPLNGKNYPGVLVKRDGENVRIVYDDGDKADLHIGKCRQSRVSRNIGM